MSPSTLKSISDWEIKGETAMALFFIDNNDVDSTVQELSVKYEVETAPVNNEFTQVKIIKR